MVSAGPAIGKPHAQDAGRNQILRFEAAERHAHWAVAIPFMVCYATALILVTVYNPHPERPFRQVISWTHRLSGVCLGALPLWTIARHRRRLGLHFHNVREAFSWTVDDFKWLFLIGPATFINDVSLPDQGKFNAAEKLNFMILVSTYPMYLVTGLTIWLPGIALLAWLIHFSMALTATPLMFGHIFMATINPDTRVGLTGMITGYVDRHWAKHHYALWYKELYEKEDLNTTAVIPAEILGVLSAALSEATPDLPLTTPVVKTAAHADRRQSRASEPLVTTPAQLDTETGSLA